MKRSVTAAVLLASTVLAGAAQAQEAPAFPLPYDAERGVFSFANQIEQALPAVVRVTTLSRSGPSSSGAAATPREISGGSGVIIDAAAGIVVTNQHVVEGGNTYRVDLIDGRSFDATLLGADDATDIAVLQISATNLSQVPIVDSDTLRTGDLVFAVGHPLGLDQTLTMGVISGLGRSGMGDAIEDYIQTDAAVNSGNSGGPLLDSAGRLIGINTAILSGSLGGGNDGVAFAVPSRIMLAVADQLRTGGSVRRGRIGATLGSLTPARARELGTPIVRGAVVEDVVPGSPAEAAGLRRNDVIIRIGGRAVEGSGGVTSTVGIAAPGSRLDIVYLRASEEMRTTVTVEEPPATPRTAVTGVSGQAFGAGFRDLRPTDRSAEGLEGGALITFVEPGSVAAAAGLVAGDVVVRVNTTDILSAEDLDKEFRDHPEGVQLVIVRGGERFPISLMPA